MIELGCKQNVDRIYLSGVRLKLKLPAGIVRG